MTMGGKLNAAVLAGIAGLTTGCLSDEFRRADGLTDSAGDAIASNTVMQMVDPWPYGVQNTKLLVPAERASGESSSGDAADASQSQTTTSSDN
jgi:hypothetical protein